MQTCTWVGVALVVSSLAGCDRGAGTTGSGESSSLPRPQSAEAGLLDGGRSVSGLNAFGNKPEVALLLRKALGCKKADQGFPATCLEHQTWIEARDGFEDGRADATLVEMLADPDERVRLLASEKLAQLGVVFTRDRRLAERVVLAAESERGNLAALDLGGTVAKIDVEGSGLFERVRALALRHPVTRLRVGIAGRVAFHNQGSLRAYELTKELVRDGEADVRLAAIGAFWEGGGNRAKETCQVWKTHLEHTDAAVASRAAELLPHWGRCQDSYPDLLNSIEHRFHGDGLRTPGFVLALVHLCEDNKSGEAQKKRALSLAQQLSENKTVERQVRGAALEAVLQCDPVGGRPYVRKFDQDPDVSVRARAVELLRPK